MQGRGLLHRSHGGALPAQPGALFDPTLQEKEKRHHSEKVRIAAAAAELVQERQCVMLDSGTTTTAVALALKKFSQLTIITNGVNIAAELTGTHLDVILTGGMVRKNSFSLVGPLAEEMVADMHADILFLGVDGFDLEIGLTTPNLLESRVNRPWWGLPPKWLLCVTRRSSTAEVCPASYRQPRFTMSSQIPISERRLRKLCEI